MIGNISVGQMVYSKCGRDRGVAFVVVAKEKEFVYLVDGKHRKLEKPKKKKVKHIQCTHKIFPNITIALEEKQYLLDADIRKALQPYTNSVSNHCKINVESD